MAESSSDSPFSIKENCNNNTVWNTQSSPCVKEEYNHMSSEHHRLMSKHFSSSIIQTIQRDERRKDFLFEQQRRRFIELMNKRGSPADSESLSSVPQKDVFDLKGLNESLPSASANATSDDECIKWKAERKQRLQELIHRFLWATSRSRVYFSALDNHVPLIADSEKSMDNILKRKVHRSFFRNGTFIKNRTPSLSRKAHFRTYNDCKFSELSFKAWKKAQNQEIQDSNTGDNIPPLNLDMIDILNWNIEKFNDLSIQSPSNDKAPCSSKQEQNGEMKNSYLDNNHQNVEFQSLPTSGNEIAQCFNLDSEKGVNIFPASDSRRVNREQQENVPAVKLRSVNSHRD